MQMAWREGKCLGWQMSQRRYAAHPAPVPAGERLPGEGDCDAEGRCWFITYDDAWLMEDRTYAINAGRSHWLPHWALPLPGVEPPESEKALNPVT
jgi:hypothetical protein